MAATSNDASRTDAGATSRPIDLEHLSRQTSGDRQLELEVLSIFARQIHDTVGQMSQASTGERKRLVHTLKGSARSLGAFRLAQCLEDIEAGKPGSDQKLPDLVDDVCDFIAAIGR